MTLCLARNVLGLYKACPAAVEKERSTSKSLFYGGQDSHWEAKQESAREDSVCLCWRPRRAERRTSAKVRRLLSLIAAYVFLLATDPCCTELTLSTD